MKPKNALQRRDAEVLAEPGADPLGDSVLQPTQTQALLLATDDHSRISSAERGMAAFLEAQLLDKSTQHKELNAMLAQLPGEKNETLERLKTMQRQAAHSTQVLSTVGYDRLRDLHAGGLLLSDIAADLNVNFNDLLAFMRQFPNAEQHAIDDAESCADAQTAQLLHDIESKKKPDTATVDMMKIRANVQLEMNKRLSGKWAQKKEEDRGPSIHNQSQFNVYLNAGGKQVQYDPQAGVVGESTIHEKVAFRGPAPESLEPEVVSNEPDASYLPPSLDTAADVESAFSEQGVSLRFGPAQPVRRPREPAPPSDYPKELVDTNHERVSPPTVRPRQR